MILPDLTPSNEKAIKALTCDEINNLDPLARFREFADTYNKPLVDDPEFSLPLYPDLEDYNYLHDTSRLTPIYINDYDINVKENCDHIARITRMEFSENTFDTKASCTCGNLSANYLLNSGRICDVCGDPVELFLNKGGSTKLWLKKPEGVLAFINIGFYNTFLTKLNAGGSKKGLNIPRYFMDSSYRRAENRSNKVYLEIIEKIKQDLEITQFNLNTFYLNFERLIEYLLLGPGKRSININGKQAKSLYEFYLRYKHVAFCDYVKVPNRYSTILEHKEKDKYSAEGQLETARFYYAIASTMKSDEYYELTEKDKLSNVDIVGKNLIALSQAYVTTNNPKRVFHKSGISRKHVCSGAVPFTGRSVITSTTGIMNPGFLAIPWNMALGMMEHHITNHLYRLGMTPWQAAEHINLAAYKVDKIIDKLFKEVEEKRKSIIQTGRNPSIEYLSLRSFFMMVNRDLHDESIKLPILTVGQFNADFDGDQMYLVLMLDNESKAKAYGSFGHHQMLDANQPFKIGRYAGQPATNLMNLNTLMIQEPVQGLD